MNIDRAAVKDAVFRVATGLHRELYRRTGGKFGANVGKMQMMLLTTTGRRSGQPRTTPLNCIRDGDRYLAVGSFGGDDRDPQWVKNLQANPEATIQIGADTSRCGRRWRRRRRRPFSGPRSSPPTRATRATSARRPATSRW